MSESEDELRRMLAGLDPMAGVPVEPVTSPQARDRLEQIMQSTNTEDPDVTSLRRRPRAILAAAASVAVLALGIGVGLSQVGGDSSDIGRMSTTTLALKAPGPAAAATQACLAFSAEELRRFKVAFGGTAIATDEGGVVLSVDRWYAGGDAAQVSIALPPDNIESGPFEFVVGKRYLISADQGTVNGCGFSGPATADYEKTFIEAFPR